MHYFKDFQLWPELTEVIGFGGLAHKDSGGMHGRVTVVRGCLINWSEPLVCAIMELSVHY